MNWLFTHRRFLVFCLVAAGIVSGTRGQAQTITVSSISPANPCPGSSVTVTFATTGSFSATNTFSLQLSDNTGSFAAPTAVASLTATPTSATTLSVSGTLSSALGYSTAYRFRVRSSVPIITSAQSSPVQLGTAPPVAGQGGSFTFCQNSGQQPLTATGTNIEWFATIGSTTPIATGSPFAIATTTTPQQYFVSQTVNGCKSSRALVNVNLFTTTTAPTVVAPGPYCAGQGPATLSATATGNGSSSAFKWVSAAGTQTAATIPAPQTSGTYAYTVSQFDVKGCPGASSTVISVVVNPAPAPAPTPNVPGVYCADNPPAQLSAGVAGAATAVKWYNLTDNVQITAATIPAPTITKRYQVSQFIGACESPLSPVFTVTVTPKPGNPVLSSAGPFCQNSGTQTISAAGSAGSTIEWFVNNTTTTVASTGTSFGVATGTAGAIPVYFRQIVTGCASDRVTGSVTVNPTPATSPTVNVPAAYCSDALPGPLTATLTGGATSAKWYPVGGTPTTGLTFPTPATTRQFQVSQSINACEGPLGAAFTVTVKPKPGNPLPGNTVGPFCQNTGTNNVQTVTASGSANSTIEWFTTSGSNTVSATGTSYTVATGIATPQTVFYRQVVDGCASNLVSLVVPINPLPAAPGVSNVAVCQNTAAPVLTATGTNLTWYLQGSTVALPGAPTPSTAQANSQTIYEVTQTNSNGCVSTRSAGLTFLVRPLPALPTLSTTYDYCEAQAPTQLTASGTAIRWYTSGNGFLSNNTLAAPNTAGVYSYKVTQTDANNCQSDFLTVPVRVKATPVLPGINYSSGIAAFCQGRDSRPLEATGNNLLWYPSATSTTGFGQAPVPPTTSTGDTDFFVTQTNGDGCQSARRTITARVFAIPGTPTFPSAPVYCAEETANLLVANGQSLLWYTTATGGSGNGQAPRPGTSSSNVGVQTFFVTQTVNGCESLRQSINVTVKRKPDVPSGIISPDFCQTYPASTISAQAEAGASLIWVTNGVESPNAPVPSNVASQTFTYEVLQNLNGCRSNRATLSIRVKPTPGRPGITPFQLCQLSPGRALQVEGNNPRFYDGSDVFLGTTAPVVPTDQPRTFSYRVTQSTDGCEGPKADYVVVVQPKPAPPVTRELNYCLEGPSIPDQARQDVRPLTAQGENLRWFFVDGNPFPAAPTPQTSFTYVFDFRVTQTVNNCVSDQAILRVSVREVPAPVLSTTLVTYCRNEQALPLQATGTNLRWIDPNGVATDQVPTPPTNNATKGGETYQVFSRATNGCVSARSVIKLVINTNPTLGLLGSTTINYGQTAPLRLRFTSSPPYTYTLTDGTSGTATDTLSTVMVKPLQTTTYRVASISNVCGNGLPGNPATATITVNIPTITTQALVNSNTLCAGTAMALGFTTTGTFNAGNVFRVQVADTTSKSYIDLPTLISGNLLSATLPPNLQGGPYFVRVVATNPGAEVSGQRSPSLLTVRGRPTAVLSGTQSIFEGSSANLSITFSGDGPWTISYPGSTTETVTFSTNANPHILVVQPAQTATYQLAAVSNNCGTGPVSGTAIVTVLPLLALENPLNGLISIYPVPTRDVLTVNLDLPMLNGVPLELALFDMKGVIVQTQETNSRRAVLNLSHQQVGMYLLHIRVGDHRIVRKVQKL